jgi:hypothetical protein
LWGAHRYRTTSSSYLLVFVRTERIWLKFGKYLGLYTQFCPVNLTPTSYRLNTASAHSASHKSNWSTPISPATDIISTCNQHFKQPSIWTTFNEGKDEIYTWEWRSTSTHSDVEVVNGQLQSSNALPAGKEHQMHTEHQAGWAPDLVWTLGKRKQYLDPAGNKTTTPRTSDHYTAELVRLHKA